MPGNGARRAALSRTRDDVPLMSSSPPLKKKVESAPMPRRSFLRWSTLLGTAAAAVKIKGKSGAAPAKTAPLPPPAPAAFPSSAGERMVRVGCPSHNCGGRCLLRVSLRHGRIVRIDTDDRIPDAVENPQLRACPRGRAYRRRQYHPDRLTHPLKRVGPRGEGKFVRVSWDEALDRVASELRRVKETYGNQALYVPYGTGSYNQTNGRQTAQRLMNLFGGSLGFYNSYSWAAIQNATPTVYGTNVTGNQRQDWLNARLIIMWGWNPAEMRDGT
ncbi:MAG: hypothetical protein FJY83_01985, partial [Candidatus Aminicenantes bacterium]|nr:hypothetical protein [Candidatus Aminicenantes bacterium]